MFVPDRTRPLIEEIKTQEGFGSNEIDEVTQGTTYIGKTDTNGTWVIQRLVEADGVTTIRYATVKLNPETTSYADAWTNRASLSFGYYADAF